MRAVQILLAILLCAKIGWNLCVPYALSIAARRGVTRGTSLILYLEWALLGLCVGASAATSGQQWYDDPGSVAWTGAGIIVASYVHFMIVAAVFGLVGASKRKGP